MIEPETAKVAIVCDWLTGIGGAERVILELHRMFPKSPIYTSQYDPSKIDWFTDADVRTTWLQKLPAGLKKFLPVLRAWSFSRLDLSNYDLVISAGSAEAKAIKTSSHTVHVHYCYAPTHYYWSRYDYYMKHPGFGKFNWLAKLGLRILVGPLRRWDYKAAQRPDHLIAISTHIQTEIKKYYNRDSSLIHPPVDMARFQKPELTNLPRNGYVITGRQTPYKRIDLAIKACNQLRLPLTVIGSGPEHAKLNRLAGDSITFITGATDEEVAHYLATAVGFIFPGLDDFGIAPVEAMAAGTPVVAYKAGGALDYVVEGKSGTFFAEQTVEALASALQAFNASIYPASGVRAIAKDFSTENFVSRFQETLKALH